MGDFMLDEKKLEGVLSALIKACTQSIFLPGSGRICSVAEQADELLRQHGGCAAAAAEQAARTDDDVSWRARLPDVLLQQVPIVGDSTLLIRELWRSIRRCALIAHVYGHDLEAAETQAQILTCLISTGGNDATTPPGCASSDNNPALGGATGQVGDGTDASGTGGTSGSNASGAAVVASTGGSATSEVVHVGGRLLVVSVSRALLREALVRGTGMRYAGQLYRVVEAGGTLLKARARLLAAAARARYGGSDGSVSEPALSANDGHAAAHEPLMAAREAIGSVAGCVPSVAPPPEEAATEASAPNAARVALVVFRPPSPEERPAVIAALLAAWLLPILAAAVRFVHDRMVPILRRRVQVEMPLVKVLALVLLAQAAGLLFWVWFQRNWSVILRTPATLVFALYAMLPGISVFLATRGICKGAAEAPFFVLLGVFNFSSGYLRFAEDLRSDAWLEQKPPPAVAGGKERVQAARELLWLLLLVDFAVEELLGRVCRLHSWRLLGPPASASDVSLLEYRTLSFAMGLVAAWAQVRVLELLQRRTVLMRLLGARQAILAGASLLFMGVQGLKQYRRTVSWLSEVSPTPFWCCTVLWIRQNGVIFAAVLPLALHTLMTDGWLGGSSPQAFVCVALATGVLLGHGVNWTMLRIWREKGEHLESDYRVLLLLPRTSASGRRLAAGAMSAAKKRCAEGATSTAMEWAASRFVSRAADYLSTRILVG